MSGRAFHQFGRDLLGGIAYVCSKEVFERYPRSLPVLVLAGEKDTTLDRLRGLRALPHALREAQTRSPGDVSSWVDAQLA